MFYRKYLCCALIWIIPKLDCVATNESCPIYVELLPNKMIKILNEEELCRCLEFKPAEVLEKKLSCDLETSFSDGQLSISATSVCGCIGYATDTKKILPKLLEINIPERTSSESSVTRLESTTAKKKVEKNITFLSSEEETPSYSEEETNDSTDVNESEFITLELPKFETNTTNSSRNHFEITTELNDETKVSTHGESTLSSNVESTIIEDYTETPYLTVSVPDITAESMDSNSTNSNYFTSLSMLKNKIENGDSSQEGDTIPAIRKPTENNDYDYYEEYGTIITVSLDEENINKTDNIDKSSLTSLDSDSENDPLIKTTENYSSERIKITKAYDLKSTSETNFVYESDQYYKNTREYKSSTAPYMVNSTEKLDEQTTIGSVNAQRNQQIILATELSYSEEKYSDTESVDEFREPLLTELENKLRRTTSIHDELKDGSGDGSYLYDDSDTEDVTFKTSSKLAHRYFDTDDLDIIATASTVADDDSDTKDLVGYYKYSTTEFSTKKGESRTDNNNLRDIVIIILGLLLATLVAVLIALYVYTSCLKRGSYDLQPSGSNIEMGSR